jgi:hypothetical protein
MLCSYKSNSITSDKFHGLYRVLVKHCYGNHFEKLITFKLGYMYMYEGMLIRLTPLFIYDANYVNSSINFRGCIYLGLAF